MMSQLTVQCPTCGTQVIWAPTSNYRPFCSSRCRLIDLGEWASESNRIPEHPTADHQHSLLDEVGRLSEQDVEAEEPFFKN